MSADDFRQRLIDAVAAAVPPPTGRRDGAPPSDADLLTDLACAAPYPAEAELQEALRLADVHFRRVDLTRVERAWCAARIAENARPT